jgi:hypothetical protein
MILRLSEVPKKKRKLLPLLPKKSIFLKLMRPCKSARSKSDKNGSKSKFLK